MTHPNKKHPPFPHPQPKHLLLRQNQLVSLIYFSLGLFANADVGVTTINEEEVRKALSQGKRLRVIDLINHFKAALVDGTQKAKITEITRKMCSIVDEGGVKYLMLKPEYTK